MVIKLYMSSNSGNKVIDTQQSRILMILKSLNIQVECVDIASPGNEDARDYMRQHGKKKEGQRYVLPPQIFNEEKYCGDYDDFDLANEDDVLEKFLGIPRKDGTENLEETKSKPDEKPVKEVPSSEAAAAVAEPKSTPKPTPPPLSPPVTVKEASPPPALIPPPVPPVSAPVPEPQAATTEKERNEENDDSDDRAAPEGALDHERESTTTVLDHKREIDISDHEINSLKKSADKEAPEQQISEVPAPLLEPLNDYSTSRIVEDGPEDPSPPSSPSASKPQSNDADLFLEPTRKRSSNFTEVEERKGKCGFQDIKNAARFWKASQMMGTPSVVVPPRRPEKKKEDDDDELGSMWAPYQTRMVTQVGKVINTSRLITF